MEQAQQDIIRARALSLWEIDGRPEGRDLDYWLAAERDVLNAEAAPAPAPAPAGVVNHTSAKAAPKAAAPKASKPAAPKKPRAARPKA